MLMACVPRIAIAVVTLRVGLCGGGGGSRRSGGGGSVACWWSG